MTGDGERRAGDEASYCRCLKTKMLYVVGPQGVDFGYGSTTAQYFCVRTMNVLGPDDDQVRPEACARGTGRGCFCTAD